MQSDPSGVAPQNDPIRRPDGSGKLRPSSPVSLLLIPIFLIALLLRVGVAIYSPSIEWGDEIFNSLEPAHHLAYGYGVVVWEWRLGIRSWVFPAVLAGVMRATDWMAPGSAGYLRAIAILLSLLSLTTVWFAYAWAKRAGGNTAATIAAGACATWYDLVYFAPKTLIEVMATNFLLPGLYLGMYGGEPADKKRLFFAGLFLGLAVSLRIQLAPAVGFAVLYFCHRNWRTRVPAMFLGLLLPVVVFGLVDAITWSYPFQSFFRYFWAAAVQERNLFGQTEPWYWYLLVLPLRFLPLFLFALVGVRRSPFLGWVVLIIVAFHSVIPHKELRYMYVVMPIIITLAALGFVEFAEDFKAWGRTALSSRAIMVAGLVFCVVTSALFAWRSPRWTHSSGGLIAMDQLSRDSSVCGVGLYKLSWIYSGGYSHLHHNVPIVLVLRDDELEDQAPSFNALVTGGTINDQTMGFQSSGCWNGVCLYRRAGSCSVSGKTNEINKVLRETGR
jgi:GPI mannosyltransferase 3